MSHQRMGLHGLLRGYFFKTLLISSLDALLGMSSHINILGVWHICSALRVRPLKMATFHVDVNFEPEENCTREVRTVAFVRRERGGAV
jgi:hypothetical protein